MLVLYSTTYEIFNKSVRKKHLCSDQTLITNNITDQSHVTCSGPKRRLITALKSLLPDQISVYTVHRQQNKHDTSDTIELMFPLLSDFSQLDDFSVLYVNH